MVTITPRLWCEFNDHGADDRLLKHDNMLTAPIRAIAAWAVERFFGDKIFAGTMRASRVRTVTEYTENVARRNEFIRSFHEQVRQLPREHSWDS